MSTEPKRRSPAILGKVALSVATFVVCLLVAEGIARIGDYDAASARAAAGEVLQSFEGIGRDLAPPDEEGALGGGHAVLHPYLAYDSEIGLRTSERSIRELRAQDHEDVFTILVFGGSVARHFCGYKWGALDILRRRLKDHPTFENRRLRTYCFARAGYKQPQQALALAYALSCGAVPDVVINLDGFNEITRGSKNPELGLPTAWPSAYHWAHLTRDAELPAEALDHIVEMRGSERAAQQLAATAERYSLFRSALLGRMLIARLRGLRTEWTSAQTAYAELMLKDAVPVVAPEDVPTFEQSLEASADDWFEASRVMHDLCSARGILYLHLIQPALHLEGTKPISPEERAKGFPGDAPSPRVVQGYPMLQERAQVLAARGEQILDLTNIFADVEEPLYFDDCHFVREGHMLIAERIAEELLARFGN